MEQSDNQVQHDRLLNESFKSDGKKGKTPCCPLSSSWIKTFLIFFTSIIMAIALAFIGLGVYLSVIRNPIFPLLLGETAYVNTYLLICIGIMLIIVCTYGFIAISTNKSTSLKLYATILAFALILQFCAAAAAMVYYKLAYIWNTDALIQKMNQEYHLADTDTARAVDDLQKQFHCCGARNYRDWHGTGFEVNSKIAFNRTSTIPTIVPNSCCIGPYTECGKIIHPSNIYYKGCMSAITDELNSTLFIICVVLLALAVVELFRSLERWPARDHESVHFIHRALRSLRPVESGNLRRFSLRRRLVNTGCVKRPLNNSPKEQLWYLMGLFDSLG